MRGKTEILEKFIQSDAKDKNYPAHFRKKCPLECEGIKTFVQNQIFCPKECERVVTFPVYENNTKEA